MKKIIGNMTAENAQLKRAKPLTQKSVEPTLSFNQPNLDKKVSTNTVAAASHEDKHDDEFAKFNIKLPLKSLKPN